MKQISLSLNENEVDKFLNLLKSFKTVKNLQTSDASERQENVSSDLNEKQKFIVENRLEKYLNGTSKSATWEEVKKKARFGNDTEKAS